LGAFPKAEAYLRRARKADPEDPLLATWLGDNLFFQEKYKEAEKVYAEATQLDPKSFYAWRGLGFTQGKMKRWNDAVQSLEKAKEIKPEDHDVLVSLGDIYLAELEEPEKALENYEAYVQAGGTDPSIPALITEIRKLLGK
jgi:tetratricopeptide (TPR) repeat protein